MRILIDECLPRALKRLLVGHACRTVQEMGWSGKSNGTLLSVAEKTFDVLLTIDQGMEHEQNFATRNIALLAIRASSNDIDDLAPIVPAVLAALEGAQPGTVIRLG